MNLVLPQCNMDIEWKPDQAVVVALEHPAVLTSVLADLWEQANGNAGEIILSDGDKILNIEKTVDLIFNPFMVSCNDKKIIAKLHKEIQESALETHYEDMQLLNSAIVNLLEDVTSEIPYGVKFNLELDLLSLLKTYSVSLAEDAETFLEKMIEYFKVMHRIGGCDCFVALDFRKYFSLEELKMFYDFIMQEHLRLLILEGSCLGKLLDDEKLWILDQDLCIINIG